MWKKVATNILGKIECSKIQIKRHHSKFSSSLNSKYFYFNERKKTPKNNKKQKERKKRNMTTKWQLLQNDKNADTTLLHSHDDLT